MNETVERRNFRHKVQQRGESFNDFLISLPELVKSYNFCSETCTQKSIRDQIIEGLRDADKIDLLQMSNLTLTATVAKYQSREAAKKHCSEIALQGSDVVAVLHKPHQAEPQVGPSNCAGCGVRAHRGGRRQCPAFI